MILYFYPAFKTLRMKKYFIYQDNQQVGPLTFEELQARNLGRETMVWFDGLAEWKKAGDLLELNDLFQSGPPPVPAGTYGAQGSGAQTNPGERPAYVPGNYGAGKPKNWLVESILVTLFCCLPFGIVAIVNAAKVDSRFATGDMDGAVQASAEAKKWTSISFFVGIGVSVLYLIYMGVMIGSMGGF